MGSGEFAFYYRHQKFHDLEKPQRAAARKPWSLYFEKKFLSAGISLVSHSQEEWKRGGFVLGLFSLTHTLVYTLTELGPQSKCTSEARNGRQVTN
jgi:hypothetical protein